MRISEPTMVTITSELAALIERNVFDKLPSTINMSRFVAETANSDNDTLTFRVEIELFEDFEYRHNCNVEISWRHKDEAFEHLRIHVEDPDNMIEHHKQLPIKEIMYDIEVYMLNEGAALLTSEELMQSGPGGAINAACLTAIEALVEKVGNIGVMFSITDMAADPASQAVGFTANVEVTDSTNTKVRYSFDVETSGGTISETIDNCVKAVTSFIFGKVA